MSYTITQPNNRPGSVTGSGQITAKLFKLPVTLFQSLPINYSANRFKAPTWKFSLFSFGRNRRSLKWLLIALVGVGVLTAAYFLLRAGGQDTLGANKTAINQTYAIVARDKDGRSLGTETNLVITDAEKTSSVLIQGKRYNTRNGKLFLLINFEMDNPDTSVYYTNPTDLVRYQRVDGKKFAPTVHQGIVQVRPQSTKNSNVGFVVDESEKNFTIEIGEVDGTKQTLEIKF